MMGDECVTPLSLVIHSKMNWALGYSFVISSHQVGQHTFILKRAKTVELAKHQTPLQGRSFAP